MVHHARRPVTEYLEIDRHLNGPPESANGGIACAEVALRLGGEAEVTLHLPPPLGVRLSVVYVDDGLELRGPEGELVASGHRQPLRLDPLPPVDYATACAAATRFAGRRKHPFPTCFSCGPGRDPSDALCIYPGPVRPDEKEPVAANWIPRAHLADPERPSHAHLRYVGGAIDCAGAWAIMPDEGHVLLGRMHFALRQAPRIGEPCVVMGWSIGQERRKYFSGTAAYGEDGRLLAMSRQTWIRVAD